MYSNSLKAGACLAASVLVTFVSARSSAHQASAGQQAPSLSTMSGVYTPAQADKGEELYMTLCTGCHAGGTYAALGATWTGRPVLEMFDLLQETMPKNDPGSLTAAETAQIVAFMLKINRVPTGKSELPSKRTELERLVFEFPPKKIVAAVRRSESLRD